MSGLGWLWLTSSLLKKFLLTGPVLDFCVVTTTSHLRLCCLMFDLSHSQKALSCYTLVEDDY